MFFLIKFYKIQLKLLTEIEEQVRHSHLLVGGQKPRLDIKIFKTCFKIISSLTYVFLIYYRPPRLIE